MVTDIQAGEGKIDNLFYSVGRVWYTLASPVPWVRVMVTKGAGKVRGRYGENIGDSSCGDRAVRVVRWGG
jgi:hypothetical protein